MKTLITLKINIVAAPALLGRESSHFPCLGRVVSRLTREIPSDSKGEPIFNPQHNAIVLGDGAQQRHGLPSDHHLVLGLLREGRRLTWRGGQERKRRPSVLRPFSMRCSSPRGSCHSTNPRLNSAALNCGITYCPLICSKICDIFPPWGKKNDTAKRCQAFPLNILFQIVVLMF